MDGPTEWGITFQDRWALALVLFAWAMPGINQSVLHRMGPIGPRGGVLGWFSKEKHEVVIKFLLSL